MQSYAQTGKRFLYSKPRLMCFSAAKEIAVKGSRDLRAYFRYKGRAIAMVS
jgi:hypothetical protein